MRRRILWLAMTLVAAGSLAAIVRAGQAAAFLTAAYWFGTLLVPFAGLAGLCLAIALVPAAPRWRVAAGLAGAYLCLALYAGTMGYLMIPAYQIVGHAPDRGVYQSLWEMHGDELGYAEQYAHSDPERYQAAKDRVRADRMRYLGLWAVPTLGGLAIGALALLVYWSGAGRRCARARVG